jgi:hypothetical protein
MKTRDPFSLEETQRTARRCIAALSILIVLLIVAGCGKKTADAPADDPAVKHTRSEVEQGPVRVTAEVQPVHPRLSDSPTLTLTYDAEEGVKVEKPLFGQRIGRFVIRDVREPLPKTKDGRTIIQQVYTLEPTEPGRLRIDPIAVSYTDARPQGDHREHTIETDALSVEVTSVLGDKTPKLDDLHGPASPIALESPSYAWLWALIAFVVAIVAARYWRKRRVAPQRKMAAVKILTPEELANQELDKLVASGLAATDIKAFYVALTDIVRRYIERTTGVRAPELTTEEFLREIARRKTFDQEVRSRLQEFLETADLVKFAAHQPNPADVDESVRRARLFIDTKKTLPC